MINELVIHLGDTKTGSTSIQKTLAQGLYETDSRLLYTGRSNHTRLALTFIRKSHRAERAARFEHLNRVFAKSDADYGIISSEHFQFVDPQDLDAAIAAHWPGLRDRIRLVAYVRPHAGKFLSAFSQRVKHSGWLSVSSVEEAIKKAIRGGQLCYMPRFTRWREVFGDRFTLRPFIRDRLHRGDVVEDFFRIALGDGAYRITERVKTNTSLTMGQLSLLQMLHKRMHAEYPGLVANEERKRVLEDLALAVSLRLQGAGLGAEGRKPRLPASMVERFQEHFAEDAAALDAAFFDGTPMSDALQAAGELATTEEQSLDPACHFPPEVLQAVNAFTDLLAPIMAVSPETVRQVSKRMKWGRLPATLSGKRKVRRKKAHAGRTGAKTSGKGDQAA